MFPTDKQRLKAAKMLMSTPETPFERLDLSKVPHPKWMTRCFRNNRYCIMIADNEQTSHGAAIRCMVQRHDNIPIPRHWSEMQRIKNEIFGQQTVAIEYYPASHALVDTANIYWLWVFPEGILPIPINPT